MQLRKDSEVGVEVIDPAGLDLRGPGMQNADVVKPLQEKVTAATGVILSTPEYHGSYSSVIKMLIDLGVEEENILLDDFGG